MTQFITYLITWAADNLYLTIVFTIAFVVLVSSFCDAYFDNYSQESEEKYLKDNYFDKNDYHLLKKGNK